jgi:hypothetical protein
MMVSNDPEILPEAELDAGSPRDLDRAEAEARAAVRGRGNRGRVPRGLELCGKKPPQWHFEALKRILDRKQPVYKE